MLRYQDKTLKPPVTKKKRKEVNWRKWRGSGLFVSSIRNELNQIPETRGLSEDLILTVKVENNNAWR